MASIPMTACPKISFRARLQTDPVSGKPVLLYPEGVLMLNPTGHAIVSLCDGQATVEELISTLAARYKVGTDKISAEVTRYLERLRERNLLELADKRAETSS
jgi:pyrroloquinoline quinone biosynthesis protein D